MIYVASYCRVSTDGADQSGSFESQKRYFEEYIARRPDWRLYRVYADEGLSGTSVKNRAEFARMMDDARRGKFSLIVTKEVSRFSRNILDTIACTRELKSMGVGVFFVSDGINTLDPDAELRLSIMGSIAQEESRRTSARVKWGQTRRMEQGVVFGRSLLGYTVRGGTISVEEHGAETVRRIFRMYAHEHLSAAEIARRLCAEGAVNSRGAAVWSSGQITKILRNEKYAGDLVQKKTITPDYLTHAKRRNRGEEELVIIRGHHEPVIDAGLWQAAQEELLLRGGKSGKRRSAQLPLSGRIFCGCCGAVFVARMKSGGRRVWACREALRGGCGIGVRLRDELAAAMAGAAIRSALGGAAGEAALCAVRALERAQDAPGPDLAALEKKKAAAMEAFLTGRLPLADMELFLERCAALVSRRSARIRPEEDNSQLLRRARALTSSPQDSAVLLRMLVGRIEVFPDRHAELSLCRLPQKWIFTLK